jgi:hypothetical protein
MARYGTLTSYLLGRSEAVVTLSFSELDRLVNGLPASARKYQAWWANSYTGQPHAQFWLDAHRQAKPDFNAGIVRFVVGGDNSRGPNWRKPKTGDK